MDADQVGWVADLEPWQALLVEAFRSAATALAGARRGAWRDVEHLLGALVAPREQADTLRHFRALMSTLGRKARAMVRFHAPYCPCLGGDEASFLALCNHLVAGRNEAARMEARGLVREPAVDSLLRHGSAFALRLEPPAAAPGRHAGGPGRLEGDRRLH